MPISEGTEGIREILALREEGALDAELEGDEHRRYVLILYELYPNGTSSNEMVLDPQITRAVGEWTGLGAPTDRQGWGIWVVGPLPPQPSQTEVA